MRTCQYLVFIVMELSSDCRRSIRECVDDYSDIPLLDMRPSEGHGTDGKSQNHTVPNSFNVNDAFL